MKRRLYFVGIAAACGLNSALACVYPNIQLGMIFVALILVLAWMIGQLTA